MEERQFHMQRFYRAYDDDKSPLTQSDYMFAFSSSLPSELE